MTARKKAATASARAKISPAQVRAWFTTAVAGKRGKFAVTPDDAACAWLARALPGMMQPHGGSRPKPLGNADAPARALLRHLPVTQLCGERLAGSPCFDAPTRARIKELNAKMAEAERAVSALVAFADEAVDRGHRWHEWSWHAAARIVRGAVSSAYHDCGLKMPLGIKPGDPVCRFVHLALASAGINVEENTVSDALRRRRGPGSKRGAK